MPTYQFGPFILDAEERRLLREGELLSLTPKAFDLLVYLVERGGHLVEKDELMRRLWKDSHVEDGNLPRTIHVLRKVLGNGDNASEYIETVPTKGYRFVIPVEPLSKEPVPVALPALSVRPTPEHERNVRLPERRLRLIAILPLLLLALAISGWHFLSSSGKHGNLVPETSSGAAFIKYQTGRLYLERQHQGDRAAALDNFEKATALDPRFAAAYAGKADAGLFVFWANSSHDEIAKARTAISKALELDPNSSYAHVVLCRIRATYDLDFTGAEAECRRAVALDPQNHEARRELGFLLSSVGRREEALKEMDVAIALAPTSFNKHSKGLILYFARRFDEAIAQLKQVEATDPDYSESSRWIARSFEQKRDYPQALEYMVRNQRSGGAGTKEIAMLRHAFAAGGWPQVLRASLGKSPPKLNLETAGTFAQLGQKEEAFEILEGMIKNRRVMVVHMDSDPRLNPLKSDPRFEQLARHIGLRDAP
jgi:DNA-binding winged helix-turn-helix (wHTH) protein/Tfp pilus assembly protein PilF